MKVAQLCVLDFTLVNLLKNLVKSIESKNHDVVTICDVKDHKDEIEKFNLKVIDFKIQRSFNIFDHIIKVIKLAIVLKKEKFDIIHVHTPIGSIIGRLASLLANNKNVYYTVHGFYFHENMFFLKKFFFIAIEYFLSFFTKKFFFQSFEDFNFAKKIFPLKKLCYIGNGIDLNLFKKNTNYTDLDKKNFWKHNLNTINDNKKVIIIARLVKQKGIFDVINLANRETMKKFDFIFVGSANSNEHDNISFTELKKNNTQKNIFFLGYKSNIIDFYQFSDLFLLPSYREGKPRSIIESMAMQLPVITTNIRGCRELIQPNLDTGFLFKPGDIDQLEKILLDISGNSNKLQNIIQKALRFAQNNLSEKAVIDKQLQMMNL